MANQGRQFMQTRDKRSAQNVASLNGNRWRQSLCLPWYTAACWVRAARQKDASLQESEGGSAWTADGATPGEDDAVQESNWTAAWWCLVPVNCAELACSITHQIIPSGQTDE